MSDTREKAIEAMAAAFDNVAVIHHEYGENLYVENTEVGIAAALDALLAVLPALGVRVVPVKMTRDMAWAFDLTDCDVGPNENPSPLLGWNAPYQAALAAAPNPLAETAGE